MLFQYLVTVGNLFIFSVLGITLDHLSLRAGSHYPKMRIALMHFQETMLLLLVAEKECLILGHRIKLNQGTTFVLMLTSQMVVLFLIMIGS